MESHLAWVHRRRSLARDHCFVSRLADGQGGRVRYWTGRGSLNSVVLQIVAWRKLEGRRKDLARISGYLMAALWLFVIVTALAGSNLSPIWVVFLSPFFLVFLTSLLVAESRSKKASLTL